MPPSPKTKDLQKKLLRYASLLISRRDYTTSELEYKLKQKCQMLKSPSSTALVASIITKLTKEHFLNDQRALQSLINSSLRKFYGPLMIYQKLLHRRLSSSEANAAIALIEKEQIRSAIQEYRLKHSSLPPQKQISRLIRRGFSYSQIQEVFDVDPSTD